jgi:magnesium chelatase subunit I
MLDLDVFVVATANPEDYTNRGRIITPLKDRYGAQLRTHYPKSLQDEIDIVEQEYVDFPDTSQRVAVPGYMKEVIAEIAAIARKSPDINQRSGVSLRVSISSYETLLGSAFKRALRHQERASPRVSDLPAIMPSIAGKIELETIEEGREDRVVETLIKKAVANTFARYFSPREFDEVIAEFDQGLVAETGSDIPSEGYPERLSRMANLSEMIRRIEGSSEPAAVASAVEFVLEGLHLNRRLNRDHVGGGYLYRK